MAGVLRAFVAIELPDGVRDRLKDLQSRMKTALAGRVTGGWARPETIHLTLKFLGNVEEARLDEIAVALAGAASGIRPFTLSVGAAGFFPDVKRPRVLWVGLKESSELDALRKNIEDLLEKTGIPREDKPFRAHLTLLRIKSPEDGRALSRIARELKEDLAVDFRVDSFILFKSILKPDGAEHRPVELIRLEGKGTDA